MFGERPNPSPDPPRSPVVSLASLFATGPWRVLWILHGLLQVYRQVLDEAALQAAGLSGLFLRGVAAVTLARRERRLTELAFPGRS